MARMAGTVTAAGLIDAGDHWVLLIAREVVDTLSIDYAVTLRFSEGTTVRIEQPFSYASPAGVDHYLVPEGDPESLAPVLSVCRQEIRAGLAYKHGRLEIYFADGSVITVLPNEEFESWSLVNSGGVRLVATPGGGLAVWHQAQEIN